MTKAAEAAGTEALRARILRVRVRVALRGPWPVAGTQHVGPDDVTRGGDLSLAGHCLKARVVESPAANPQVTGPSC